MNKFDFEKAGCEMNTDFKIKLEELKSKGELHQREVEKIESNQSKIDDFNKYLNSLSETIITQLKSKILKTITQTEFEMYSTEEDFYCYFDLDMFYAACEMLEKPELRDKPLIVGFSVISTANYAARKFGIRSGMPGFIAQKLCPELISVPVDHEKYKKYSEQVFEIIAMFDEHAVRRGIDEGYFGIQLEDEIVRTSKQLTEEMIIHTVTQLKRELLEKTGLTMSVGVSFNQRIAKMAAEKNKPDGLFILRKDKDTVYEYLDGLKIRKISGIGPVLEQLLNGIGINTIKDLRENLWKVFACFSEQQALGLLHDSIGYAEVSEWTPINPSISKSTTFKATDDLNWLNEQLRSLAVQLMSQPRMKEYTSRTLTLTLKYFDFKVKSRSVTEGVWFNNEGVIAETSIQLLKGMVDKPVRLVGIKLGNLTGIAEGVSKNSLIEVFAESKDKAKKNSEGMDFCCPICFCKIDCFGVQSAFVRHVNECLGEKEIDFMEGRGDRDRKSGKRKSTPKKKVTKVKK